MDNRGSIHVPFVTAKQKLWAGVRSDVFGSAIDGTLIRPSNEPPFADGPRTVEPPPDFVILKPSDDPNEVLNKHPYVYLTPGAIYKWSNVQVGSPVQIDGRGATVTLNGPGPILTFTGSTTAYPVDLPIMIKDVVFSGGELLKTEPMQQKFVSQSAIWFDGAWKTTVRNCTFFNFNGAAVYYSEGLDYWADKQWQQQHILTECRFNGCRIGVANGGAVEYSLANNNCFFNCQICFHVIGGNWRRVGNMIANCRCAYFHTKANMWYQGKGLYMNPAHGSFTDNTLNHCDYGGSDWTSDFVLANNTTVKLAGFYFDNDTQRPPTWTGNTQYYGDMKLLNFLTDANNTTFCVTGCALFGVSSVQAGAGQIQVADAKKANFYISGCYGNNVDMVNVQEANVVPKFGNFKTAAVTARS